MGKRCVICKKEIDFTRRSHNAITCSIECSVKYKSLEKSQRERLKRTGQKKDEVAQCLVTDCYYKAGENIFRYCDYLDIEGHMRHSPVDPATGRCAKYIGGGRRGQIRTR